MSLTKFQARGVNYNVVLLDETDVDTDPTLLVFREDEEIAVATIHLTPGSPCVAYPDDKYQSHVVVRAGGDE
jgi:hypothetical protein